MDNDDDDMCCDIHCKPGERGPRGFQGVLGANGHQGERGPQGPAPFDAQRGPQGFDGIKGNVGVQGPRGVWGVVIDTDSLGFQGYEGKIVPGPQGIIGARGVQGPDSIILDIPGPQGEQGFDGDDGAQGDTGNGGNLGPISDIARGFQGQSGAMGNIGPSNPVVDGPQGDRGMQGFEGGLRDGAIGLLGFQGSSPQNTGAQGIFGSQGPDGAKGSPGTIGPQGTDGTQGQIGVPGAIIQVGDFLTWIPQTSARYLNDTPLQTFVNVQVMSLDTVPNKRYVVLCNLTASASENLTTCTVRDEFKNVLATSLFTLTGTWQTTVIMDTFLAVGSRCLLFMDVPALVTAANFSVIQVL